MTLPLAITPGEPAGIGPDLVLKQALNRHDGPWFAIADPGLLASRATLLGLDITLQEIHSPAELTSHTPGTLPVLPVRLRAPCEPGVLNPANAAYVLETLDVAIDLALANQVALVTGPVHKGVINEAGIPFTGHTEYLETKAGVEQVVMMLATEGLRVALVTTHLPLSAVPGAITADKIKRVTAVLHAALIQDFGCPAPHILVTGLNPHAGEGGHLGREEIEIIEPTLKALNSEGLNLVGPLPADTLYTPKHLEHADATLAMYHDQGLPVLKFHGFGRAANITLGLPIVRTSVDHGTALDLAGTGTADAGSLETALKVAAQMAVASQS